MLKLYDYFRSSASFRVRIALNIKGLQYENIPIHLLNNGGEQFSPSYQKVNPQTLVPSLDDNQHIVTQSLAIIEYIDETHPTPPLLPSDTYIKALVRAFSLTIAADIHPLTNLRVFKYLLSEFHINEDQKKQWYQHWLASGLSALEKQIVTLQMSGDYCFGQQLTLADICLVAQFFSARRFDCDLSPYPTLSQIDANCQKHPAVIKAWPTETVI